jgi:hypothetical protein
MLSVAGGRPQTPALPTCILLPAASARGMAAAAAGCAPPCAMSGPAASFLRSTFAPGSGRPTPRSRGRSGRSPQVARAPVWRWRLWARSPGCSSGAVHPHPAWPASRSRHPNDRCGPAGRAACRPGAAGMSARTLAPQGLTVARRDFEPTEGSRLPPSPYVRGNAVIMVGSFLGA